MKLSTKLKRAAARAITTACQYTVQCEEVYGRRKQLPNVGPYADMMQDSLRERNDSWKKFVALLKEVDQRLC
jgi:hypothetical protein